MLFAVHISDGVLGVPWLVGGFALAGLLCWLGCVVRSEKDLDELPKLALLTAAFFVITSIHLRVPPTSVHLLGNGLLGVLLGRRVLLAIPVALLLQAVFGHGGFTTLGINSVILGVPALAAGFAFSTCQRLALVRLAPVRAAFVMVTVLIWLLCAVFSVFLYEHGDGDILGAWHAACTPKTLATAIPFAALATFLERRLELAAEFPLGLMVGGLTTLLTVALNCLALHFGVHEDWHQLVRLVFVAHLPVAAIEGLVLGFTVGFLARVKPEMVGGAPAEKVECLVDSAS